MCSGDAEGGDFTLSLLSPLFQAKLPNLPPKWHIQRPRRSKKMDQGRAAGVRPGRQVTVKTSSALAFPPSLIHQEAMGKEGGKHSGKSWGPLVLILLLCCPVCRKRECLLREAGSHLGAELLPGSLLQCSSGQDVPLATAQ